MTENPKIMGILNITPDSFSDGGLYLSPAAAYERAARMIDEGVDIFDIGGESARPGAQTVSVQEELDRILPVIEALQTLGKPISVDTQKTGVMKEVLALGVEIINDIRALQDEGALEVLAQSQAKVCLMHMQGEPRTMQAAPEYGDVVVEVHDFLKGRIAACEEAGIDKSRLIIDPGFGFGKTLSHNLQLLSSLEAFHDLGCPILVGLSRKSMFGQITGKPFDQRISSSLAATVVSLLQGATYVRTHDVGPTRDAILVLQAVGANTRGTPRNPGYKSGACLPEKQEELK